YCIANPGTCREEWEFLHSGQIQEPFISPSASSFITETSTEYYCYNRCMHWIRARRRHYEEAINCLARPAIGPATSVYGCLWRWIATEEWQPRPGNASGKWPVVRSRQLYGNGKQAGRSTHRCPADRDNKS